MGCHGDGGLGKPRCMISPSKFCGNGYIMDDNFGPIFLGVKKTKLALPYIGCKAGSAVDRHVMLDGSRV